MSSILRVTCILVLSLLCGCKEQARDAASPAATMPASQPAVVRANCLICGDHELDVDASTPTVEYHGTRYYFCSDYCKTEFGKDPEKWIARDVRRRAAKATSSASAPG